MDKLPSVQALRAVAALLVVFFHMELVLQRFDAPDYFVRLFRFGDVGVDVFFITSGFIMFHIRERYMDGRRVRAGRFLGRRFLRILPPYWAYTALLVGIFVAAPGLFQGDAPSLVHSVLLVPDDRPFFVMVGWTLTYEMYFYLLFAATMLAFRSAGQQLAALAVWFAAWILLGALIETPGPILAFLTSPLHLEFLAGGAFAVLLGSRPAPAVVGPMALALGVAAYVSVCLFVVDPSRGAPMQFPLYFATAALLFCGFHSARGWIVGKPLQALGNASYSLYLCHWPVLHAAAIAFAYVGFGDYLAFSVVAVAACCAWALVSFRAVEQALPDRVAVAAAGLAQVVRPAKPQAGLEP